MALSRTWRRILGGVLVLLAAALLGIAMFPVGVMKGFAERRLTERFGRTVTIGDLSREPGISFTPTVTVRDVRVPQAPWAGTGDLARIGAITLRVRILPLLVGRFSPQLIGARGVRLDLVRDANGRENWSKPDEDKDATGGDAPRLEGLRVKDTVIRYRDAKRNRAFTIRVAVDPFAGVRAGGTGTVAGTPVTLAARGAPVTANAGRWPFSASIDGPALTMRAEGTMASPLDTEDMALKMTARATDLKLIDAVIEAGLFGTQPVRIAADVTHRDAVWTIARLTGTVGRSDIGGRLTVAKADGRTKLDGAITSRRLDFGDFASDAGLARAAALEAREGPKIVPNTRVNLSKIDRTDAAFAFDVANVFDARQPSTIRSLRGRLVLDRQRLAVEPVTIGLAKGAITGRAVIDQQGGASSPRVTLDLRLADSTIATIAGSGAVTGRLDGRARLTGRGDTIRAAVGRSDGTIGLAARDGALPAKMAALLGFDVGRGLTGDEGARATLRCAIVRLEMRGGRGRFDPLLVDTSRSQTRGRGGVVFPEERIAAVLTGAPKQGSLLRLPGSIRAGGTIRDPQVVIPPEVKSAGNILKAIGRAITGKQGPLASDADCGALAAKALR